MNCISPAETGSSADPFAHAIGSGFASLLGFRVVDWGPGRVDLELDIASQHLNRAGSVHGGVLATLIDVACALAGLYSSDPQRVRKAVTLSLNSNFTGQVASGTLYARGRARAGGRSIYFATTEITDAEGRPIAHGEAVNRYRRGSEESHSTSDEHYE